jgi:dUTP pyrophosphatase
VLLFILERILFRKTEDGATMPTLGNFDSDGYDLYPTESGVVPPTSLGVVETGIAVDLPKGYVGLVCSRSRMVKNGLTTVEGGVIDRGYKGTMQVMLFNHNEFEDLFFTPKQRIGQLLVLKKFDGMAFCVDETQNAQSLEIPVEVLKKKNRGTEGFGSTGQ